MSVDGSFGWYSNSRSNDVIYFQQWWDPDLNVVYPDNYDGSTYFLAKHEPVVFGDEVKVDFLYR